MFVYEYLKGLDSQLVQKISGRRGLYGSRVTPNIAFNISATKFIISRLFRFLKFEVIISLNSPVILYRVNPNLCFYL